MKNVNSLRSQSGFTLIEIAIVLVIIGLLLGGVLKGTELIENSKIKKATNDINSVSAAYNSYVDRYRATPGDDGPIGTLQSRGGNWVNITVAGNNDGRLFIQRGDTFDGGNEQAAFWQQLKAAGFITGDGGAVGALALPRNAFGGLTGVTTQVVNATLTGLKVCMSQVPGKSARALDIQMDDGNGATGSMRATLSNANGAPTDPNNTALATPYNDGSAYTVCMQI